MKWCSSASSAVRVRRGSTTTTLPPRSRIARRRPRMFGAVSRLPFDTSGLAPSISRCSQRSTSGIGTESIVPNMWPAETCFGIWSTVEAEYMFCVPSTRSHAGPCVRKDRLCAFGLPL
jgi:hypothetical protein